MAFRYAVYPVPASESRALAVCDEAETFPVDSVGQPPHKPPRRRAPARLFRLCGGVGEWLNPADCKSARLAYTGSNPVPSTTSDINRVSAPGQRPRAATIDPTSVSPAVLDTARFGQSSASASSGNWLELTRPDIAFVSFPARSSAKRKS